ncbi:MAG: HEAT repeat domain-containing protein [Methanomicrobiales archaeon]|nr:HEAT repeat domain-containing protein [Methanomicrobiales archaeon]
MIPPDVEQLRESKDFKGLIQALTFGNDRLRWQAAEALGELGDIRGIDPLTKALKDSSWEVREIVIWALGKIREREKVEPLVQAQAVAQLIHVLQHADWRVRRSAAAALCAIGDPSALDAFIMLLRDPDWRVRWEAAGALGQLKDPRATEPLIGKLTDVDWKVRWEAAGALGKIRDPSAVIPLVESLKDLDWRVRWRAVSALAAIGDPRAVGPLFEAVKSGDEDFRAFAMSALEELKKKAPISAHDVLQNLRE